MKKRLPRNLSGWKDIATYLGKGVRTVQRYERDLQLPVRRPVGRAKGSVIAIRSELDAWISSSPTLKNLDRPTVHSSLTMDEFHASISELKRLRLESAESRQALVTSRDTLTKSRGSLMNTLHSLSARIQCLQHEIDHKMSGLDSLDQPPATPLLLAAKKKAV